MTFVYLHSNLTNNNLDKNELTSQANIPPKVTHILHIILVNKIPNEFPNPSKLLIKSLPKKTANPSLTNEITNWNKFQTIL